MISQAVASLEARIASLCREALIEPRPTTDAPDSLARLQHATEMRDGVLLIPVWTGASDRTIWSGPEANYLFRAWHDSHHLRLGAEFTREGERLVADLALSEVSGVLERALLWAETEGQQEHYARWGEFPGDQRGFDLACLAGGVGRAVGMGRWS